MEEGKEIKQTPLDLDDLFGGDTIVNLSIKGRVVRFTYREKDSQTDLEYQRRVADRMRSRIGEFEVTDNSLRSDLWLFDRLCKKVEVKEGDENWQDVPDYKTRLSPDVKRLANAEYYQRIAWHRQDGKN